MIKEPYRDYATAMIRLYNRVRLLPAHEKADWWERHRSRPEGADYIAVLRATSSRLTGEACLAMMAVYKPGARRVQTFVTRYAIDNYTSEATVYRLLRTARRACAEERGLTVES